MCCSLCIYGNGHTSSLWPTTKRNNERKCFSCVVFCASFCAWQTRRFRINRGLRNVYKRTERAQVAHVCTSNQKLTPLGSICAFVNKVVTALSRFSIVISWHMHVIKGGNKSKRSSQNVNLYDLRSRCECCQTQCG